MNCTFTPPCQGIQFKTDVFTSKCFSNILEDFLNFVNHPFNGLKFACEELCMFDGVGSFQVLNVQILDNLKSYLKILKIIINN